MGSSSDDYSVDSMDIVFKESEVKNMYGFKRGDNFIEVTCGCTHHRFGDTVGKLRVFPSGILEIHCQCTPQCDGVLKPTVFVKHALKKSGGRWRHDIWVTIGSEKVPLAKTALLKYHDQTIKPRNRNVKKVHRDEFLKCTRCKKERRFQVRSEKEYRLFHEAEAVNNWQCSFFPHYNITCEDEEERECKKRLRGCPVKDKCVGCVKCVCFGCEICRFSDCRCQICVDFMENTDKNTESSTKKLLSL